MAAEEKPAKPAPKILDVAKPPGAQATSRPIIVGHGAVIRDPMMAPGSPPVSIAPKTAVTSGPAKPATDDSLIPTTPEQLESLNVEKSPENMAEISAEDTDDTPTAPPLEAGAGTAAVTPTETAGSDEPDDTAAAGAAGKSAEADTPVDVTRELPPDTPKIQLNPKPATSAAPAAAGTPGTSPATGSASAEAKPAAAKTVLGGKKIEPLGSMGTDSKAAPPKDSNDPEDTSDLELPDEKKDQAKDQLPPSEKIGAITYERMAELKNGKEYKIAMKGRASQTSWTAILLIILLAGIGVAIAIDAGWIDIGVQLPFDLIK